MYRVNVFCRVSSIILNILLLSSLLHLKLLNAFMRQITNSFRASFFIAIGCLLLSVSSCKKKDTITPLDQNKVNLTGVGATPAKWNLTTLTSSGVVLTLTYTQKRYSKTFGKNGVYSDTDGFMGTWDMPSNDQLVERYVNFPSGTASTQSYQIVSVSATNLILSYTSNGTPITAVYTAGN